MLDQSGSNLLTRRTYSRARDGTTCSRSTVPVSSRVTETFANGDGLVAESGQGREHVASQVVCGLSVDVVTNREPFAVSRRSTVSSDVSMEVVLGGLDLLWVVLVIVVGINVEVGNVISEIGEVRFAARRSSTARVWWSHVGGEEPNNVANGHLVLDHLGLAISGGNCAQVQMGPSVGSDLVILGVHSLDRGPVAGGQINLSLVDVVASNEEGCLCVVRIEEV